MAHYDADGAGAIHTIRIAVFKAEIRIIIDECQLLDLAVQKQNDARTAVMGRDSPLVQYADLWESSQRNTPLCKGESLRRLNVLRPANRWAREIEPCHRFQLRPKRGAIVGGNGRT
jgi:hypothetical protein